MTQTFVFDVTKPACLNDFLRDQLPIFLQAQNARGGDCSQAQDLGPAKIAVSNSKIRRLIFSQNVFVDAGGGHKASQAQNARANKNALQAQEDGGFFVCKNPAFALHKGARVKVLFDPQKFFFQKQTGDIQFELDDSRILYEDDAIIVVNKPPHFPTEPTFVQDRDNLRAAVVRYLHKKIGLDKNPPYCGIVHRLDRDTSGVILFSKRRDCNAALFAAFDSSGAEAGSFGLANSLRASNGCKPKNAADSFGLANDSCRAAKKIYVAVCERAASFRLANNSFSVQNYLGRVSGKSQAAKWGSVPKEKGGKFARTDFKILKEEGGRVLVQAELFTGRTHQIRVHLAQSGLAILGDGLYGGRAAERIFLHALTLELPHPMTGEPLRFEAPLPPEF
ncbi:MAG: RluA family pseudouridine synthase [Treponema sp.]|nr:RluA family pseudouridine synthase [Treponema sp.]